MAKIKNVTVIGGGILGSQIAFHIAYKGYRVILYDNSPDFYVDITDRLLKIKNLYKEYLVLSEEDVEPGLNNILLNDNLIESVSQADLIIESVPENEEIKKQIFEQLGQIAPANTIFATNSSTMLPSTLMQSTARPDRFLALHFSNLLYRSNIAEIMGTTKTDPSVFASVVQFSKDIGMHPIPLKKEQPGYVLNTLLMPLLTAASELLIKGVADVETIDKTWQIATNSPLGPFQIYDFVGLNTVYNIASNNTDVKSKLFAHYLKQNFIDQGKLGYLSGEGFYKYNDQ